MLTKIHWQLAADFQNLEQWTKDLPSYFADHGRTIFKARNEVKVFEVGGMELVVKSFKVPNPVNRLAYVHFRKSKAARSFANAHRLLKAGAATPTPVAFVERLANGLLADSYYITLNHPHDFTLREVLLNQVGDKEHILAQWVNFTYHQLYLNGIFHLDYSPGNTLIRRDQGSCHFAVVDLNRMRFMTVGFDQGLRGFCQLSADANTLAFIARTYAGLCNRPADQTVARLLQFDRRNNCREQVRTRIKKWFRKRAAD